MRIKQLFNLSFRQKVLWLIHLVTPSDVSHWVLFHCLSALFTVRGTRAPMGTKATPTANLSVGISTAVHNADLCSVGWGEENSYFSQTSCHFIFDWHLPLQQTTKKITRATSPLSDLVFGLSERPLNCPQGWAARSFVNSTRLTALLQTWTELKLRKARKLCEELMWWINSNRF